MASRRKSKRPAVEPPGVGDVFAVIDAHAQQARLQQIRSALESFDSKARVPLENAVAALLGRPLTEMDLHIVVYCDVTALAKVTSRAKERTKQVDSLPAQ